MARNDGPVRVFEATVRRRRTLSPHLVTITLGVAPDAIGPWRSTGVPDEYIRLLIAPAGVELALPVIGEGWAVEWPEGAVEPASRVYTVSDHRVVDGVVEVDVDVALHDVGVGSDWARSCEPGDRVGMLEPRGLYAAAPDTGWQLLVGDITAVPAIARILRGLSTGQRAEVVVVVTDASDEVALPSAADVDVRWVVVEDDRHVAAALGDAVLGRELPVDDRYVWLAGEASANRAARRHLRRTLGWPQSSFYTCGYWQLDAEAWNRRYEEQAAALLAQAQEVQRRYDETDDEGTYLDELEDMYEKAGL